jgi:site-specific DNA-adenine methylase
VIGNTILDRVLKSLDNAKERLRGVKIYGEDYRKTVSRYDSKDTLLFLDPPYVETNVRVGEKDFDHKAFFDFLGQVKSKFLITYDKPDPTGKFKTNKLNHSAWRGTNVGTTSHTTYIITNYEIQKKSVSWKGII